MNEPILSLFPGIGILDRAFEDAGFCVFRGPDLLWGGDIRKFNPEPGYFVGIIGGPPCQDFSVARHTPATGNGKKMLAEFARCVTAVQPDWALLENVPAAPSLFIDGFDHIRLPVNAHDFGVDQIRWRHFQYFWRSSVTNEPIWPTVSSQKRSMEGIETVTSSTTVSWEKLIQLQGLPADFDLPGFRIDAKIQAVANGVQYKVAAALAEAIKHRDGVRDIDWLLKSECACGCGRLVNKPGASLNQACRKRKERDKTTPPKSTLRLERKQPS